MHKYLRFQFVVPAILVVNTFQSSRINDIGNTANNIFFIHQMIVGHVYIPIFEGIKNLHLNIHFICV